MTTIESPVAGTPSTQPGTRLAPPAPELRQRRVMSIDALRGFDMFWIMGPDLGRWIVSSLTKLIVGVSSETGTSGRPDVPLWLKDQLSHPEWTGFSAWDMIMPLFLFIVGVAMPFSFAQRLEEGHGRRAIYLHALRRVALLWILGMIAQGNLLAFKLEGLRLYSNTLQSIAAGYLIGTVALVELRSIRAQAALTAVLLVAYWFLMSFVPVPGGKTGDYSPDGNLAIWVDKAVLGRFQDGTTYTWILGSLGFGATVMMGVLAGHVLRSPMAGPRKVLVLVAAGLGCLLGGWLWSFNMPIIKHIWTSSMALWSGGWSLLLLAFFYGVIDVLGYRRWSFIFVVIGANAILAYMANKLFLVGDIGHRWFDGLSQHLGAAGDLFLACATFALMWSALWYLYRNRIFLRV